MMGLKSHYDRNRHDNSRVGFLLIPNSISCHRKLSADPRNGKTVLVYFIIVFKELLDILLIYLHLLTASRLICHNGQLRITHH